jgi:AcrR family transcriptional regulator
MSNQDLSERLAAVRREHILDAATRVFAASGFNGATIRAVAHQAGVADGTIYNYFANKEALLFGIFDRLNETEQRLHDLTPPPDADRAGFVRAYVRHRFDVFERVGFEAFQVLISELLVNPSLRARYVRDILQPTFAIADVAAERSSDATSPAAFDARLLTRAHAALVLGCLVLRLCGEPLLNQSWDAVPDVVAEVMLNSMGAGHARHTPD